MRGRVDGEEGKKTGREKRRGKRTTRVRQNVEGYALFPNPSEREARESTSRLTKMKVTEKVGALLRSVKPGVRRCYASALEAVRFRPAWPRILHIAVLYFFNTPSTGRIDRVSRAPFSGPYLGPIFFAERRQGRFFNLSRKGARPGHPTAEISKLSAILPGPSRNPLHRARNFVTK